MCEKSAVMKSVVSTARMRDDVFVTPLVAHHADGRDGDQDRQGLRDAAVEAGGFDLVDQDFVGGSEDFETFGRDFAQDADAQAGAGEGVTPDDVFGQAQVLADDADLVFEEVAERLHQLEAELGGQAADVVMELDVGGGIAVLVAGLDDVRVERALGEEFGVGDLAGLRFEGLDELGADDLTLLLRVGHAGEGREELAGPIDDAQVNVEVIPEGRDDALPLIAAEQAVIDEDADELVADGLVEQRGDDGGVHAAAEAADDGGVADLPADVLDRLGDEIAHFPVAGAAADVVEEVLQDLRAFGRVADFRMELDAEELPLGVADGGPGAGLGLGELDEARAGVGDLVAVAGPDERVVGEVGEEVGLVEGRPGWPGRTRGSWPW